MNDTKQYSLKSYFYILSAICGLSLFLFAVPLSWIDLDVSLAYILGIPPQLFVSISWVLGAWYGQKYYPDKIFLFTFGFIPIRFAIEVGWFLLLMQIANFNLGIAIASAIVHFSLFTIPQILFINNLTSK